MIRRDYILRMIEQFFQVLARLKGLKQGQLWEQAGGVVEDEFQRLIGLGPEAVVRLSETELLARVMHGEPTQVVRQKTLMVTTLLKEAGDAAVGQGRESEGRAYYLKGLHLLLQTLVAGDAADCPAFVPGLEVFTAALAGAPLPLETQARLMQHYEQAGDFAKARDALVALVKSAPDQPGVVEFGIAFYQRLQNRSDDQLTLGGLPREQLEASLADLRRGALRTR